MHLYKLLSHWYSLVSGTRPSYHSRVQYCPTQLPCYHSGLSGMLRYVCFVCNMLKGTRDRLSYEHFVRHKHYWRCPHYFVNFARGQSVAHSTYSGSIFPTWAPSWYVCIYLPKLIYIKENKISLYILRFVVVSFMCVTNVTIRNLHTPFTIPPLGPHLIVLQQMYKLPHCVICNLFLDTYRSICWVCLYRREST